MKYSLTVSLLLFCSSVFGQAANQTDNLRLANLANPNTGPLVFRFDSRYEGQHGTPYFIDSWSTGQIALTDGRQYKDVPLKFDAHRQEVIMLRPKMGNDSIIVDRKTINRFLLTGSDNQAYLFGRYPTAQTDEAILKDGYFLILYSGKSSLLKRVVKTFRQADYKGAYSANVRYDAYSDANSYYVLKPDQRLVKVKLAKKSLLDALSDRADTMTQFVNQEKLGLKTEDDAITLLKAYDSL